MRHAGVLGARRPGALLGLECDEIVVVAVETEENAPAGIFMGDLHAQHVAIEAARRVEVAHPDGHVAGSLDRHGVPLCLGRAGRRRGRPSI